MKIFVKVKPWAKVERVEPTLQGYIVYTKEPAQDGRANQRAIELLAKHLKVPKTSVTIKSGSSARYKIIEIGK